jgi:hypothetical protein
MVWGVDDCMLAVADVVRGLTGRDPARRFRGRYRTRRGAVRVLGRGGTLKAAIGSARALRWRRIAPGTAKPGDVGLAALTVKNARGRTVTAFAAMVCRAPGWFVGRNERGFTALPDSRVAFAWSIRRR